MPSKLMRILKKLFVRKSCKKESAQVNTSDAVENEQVSSQNSMNEVEVVEISEINLLESDTKQSDFEDIDEIDSVSALTLNSEVVEVFSQELPKTRNYLRLGRRSYERRNSSTKIAEWQRARIEEARKVKAIKRLAKKNKGRRHYTAVGVDHLPEGAEIVFVYRGRHVKTMHL